jgi:hypothetical protein
MDNWDLLKNTKFFSPNSGATPSARGQPLRYANPSGRCIKRNDIDIMQGLNPNFRTIFGTIGAINHTTSPQYFHLMSIKVENVCG